MSIVGEGVVRTFVGIRTKPGRADTWATAFEGMQAKNGPLGPLSLKALFSTTYHLKVKIPRHSKYESASW
jgi:hypothetical protein